VPLDISLPRSSCLRISPFWATTPRTVQPPHFAPCLRCTGCTHAWWLRLYSPFTPPHRTLPLPVYRCLHSVEFLDFLPFLFSCGPCQLFLSFLARLPHTFSSSAIFTIFTRRRLHSRCVYGSYAHWFTVPATFFSPAETQDTMSVLEGHRTFVWTSCLLCGPPIGDRCLSWSDGHCQAPPYAFL